MARRPPRPPRRNARAPRGNPARPATAVASARTPAHRRAAAWAALGVVLSLAALGWWAASGRRPRAELARAESASRAGDWSAALSALRAVNAGSLSSGATLLAEARAALALGRAGEAEAALRRAVEADPAEPQAWRLWLEILRVEDRPTDALRVGLRGVASVPPDGRRGVLRATTLALLADLPEDLARATLRRWAFNDEEGRTARDPDALAALYQRMNAMPRAGDPDRDDRIAALAALLERDPGLLPAREALATALADAGDADRGRRVLDAWPADHRDARYWRLKGRWALEYDRRPAEAAEALSRALEELPHDWKSRARLARALRALGRDAEARREAEAVGRLRERLDPAALGPFLAEALDRPDPPALADLCNRVGLTALGDAWRVEFSSKKAR